VNFFFPEAEKFAGFSKNTPLVVILWNKCVKQIN